MSLPTTRNRTYVAGVTPIASQDLNDIQDYLISAYAGFSRGATAQRTKILTAETWARAAGWTLSAGGTTWPYADLLAATVGTLWVPIPTILNERLISIVVLACAQGNGVTCAVTDVQASLRRVNAASAGGTPGSETTLIAATSLPSTAITMQKIILSAGGPYTLAADQAYYVRIAGANSAGGKQVLRVEYNYDVP